VSDPSTKFFTPEGDEGPCEWVSDAYRLLDWVQSILDAYDVEDAEVSVVGMFNCINNADRVLQNHVRSSSASDPSVFKRAAAFSIGFMMESPIRNPFGPDIAGPRIGHIPNHQNAIVALEWARWSLEGATVVKTPSSGPQVIATLSNPIKVSKHFYADAVLTLATIPISRGLAAIVTPGSCIYFHYLALVYEALAYVDNPDAAYPRVI
jgi:hypothetical protein